MLPFVSGFWYARSVTNRKDFKMTQPTQPKKFKTILADVPYMKNQTGSYGACKHYNLMSHEEIRNMPIKDIAADNAHLWFWTSNSYMEESYDIIRAWSFEPKSIFTWVKPTLGLGTYLRNSTEHVIFATRGKAPIKFKGQMNWGFFPKQDHSHKPEELFAIIERCSEPDYLELFARRPVSSNKKWAIWGNEVESDIIISHYPVPQYSKNPIDYRKADDDSCEK